MLYLRVDYTFLIMTSNTLFNPNPKFDHDNKGFLFLFEKKKNLQMCRKLTIMLKPQRVEKNVPWSKVCKILPKTMDVIISQGRVFFLFLVFY